MGNITDGDQRKNLIDMEVCIKTATQQLKDALVYVSEINVDDSTWALAHDIYSAIENCDTALEHVFRKQGRLTAGLYGWKPFNDGFASWNKN